GRAGLAQLGAPRAAADGEPLGERAQRGLGAVVVGDGDLDGHLDHAAQVGVAHIAGPGDDDEVRGRRRHRGVQADAVVQVHQAAPTSASGTPAEAMTSVGRLPAVTPVWSETSVGSKAKRDVATPPETSGSSAISVPPAPPRPTPAAVRRSVRMAASASASVTTGAAPVATSEPRVRVMTSSAGPIGSRRSTVAPSADGVSTAPETG